MRLLLDTHVALWAIVGDTRLPKAAEDLIADPTHAVVVSAASVGKLLSSMHCRAGVHQICRFPVQRR